VYYLGISLAGHVTGRFEKKSFKTQVRSATDFQCEVKQTT